MSMYGIDGPLLLELLDEELILLCESDEEDELFDELELDLPLPPPPSTRNKTAMMTTAAMVMNTIIAVNRIARGTLYNS